MKRDPAQFGGRQFDLLILGGGIYGVCAAWDAALRGLSVALIEKDDFGSRTSSNSLKIIHGGLRYLQHANFKRMRESITERSNLMRIAPHLVHPLECIMPTYGHTTRGKELMAIALAVNDIIGYDRNRGLHRQKHLPRGGVVSKEICLQMIPGVNQNGLTGGAIWYDCQVSNSERMLISILHSAVQAGAVAANYLEMVDFVTRNNRVSGVIARDVLDDREIRIDAKLVINTTGPWFNEILQRFNGRRIEVPLQLSAAMNLVVRKKLFDDCAVGIWSESEFKDEDALVSRGSRLLFVTPWRDYSLVGTTHIHYSGAPGNFRVTEGDIQLFLDEINRAYPPANLKRDDVLFSYGGLLPSDGMNPETGDVKLLKKYRIVDHEITNNLAGLLSVISVKYTTARDVAEKSIDYAMQKLGITSCPSVTSATPVFGGDVEDLSGYILQAQSESDLPDRRVEHLVRNFGTNYKQLMNIISEYPEWREPVDENQDTLKAEVVYAVREEMACKLVDVVRRRTELGSAGYPGDDTVTNCAALTGSLLNWSQARIEKEIEETQHLYFPEPKEMREAVAV